VFDDDFSDLRVVGSRVGRVVCGFACIVSLMKNSDFVKSLQWRSWEVGRIPTVLKWAWCAGWDCRIRLWSEITVGSWIPNEARAKDVQNLDVLECE
jgi:hypothetical protein